MSVLHELAEDIGVNERTLRRGLAGGLVRGRRPTARTVRLDPGEVAYLRAHWPLLASLREVLRSERNVRLAVLIGSAARGALGPGSDVDLVVELAQGKWRAQDRLADRLASAARRPVDLVELEAVTADPLLLRATLRDGRVLVDRDGTWPRLLAERARTGTAAAHAAAALRRELHGLLSELSGDG